MCAETAGKSTVIRGLPAKSFMRESDFQRFIIQTLWDINEKTCFVFIQSDPQGQDEWRRRFRSEPQDWDVDTLYDDFEPMLLALLARGTEVKPYVADTIAELRRRGYCIGSTTGYTNIMMKSVVKAAAAQGYEADFWITPDSVSGFGRPYPYMIFRNMEHFKWQQTSQVLKVGDTVTDILEGKHAGVKTAGIVVGSSVMGLSREEYDRLTEGERQAACEQARAVYEEAGADYVLHDIRDILSIAE